MMKSNICACCGKLEVEFFDICEECGWQNDPLQNENPDYAGGANEMSLNEYKQFYSENVVEKAWKNYCPYNANEAYKNDTIKCKIVYQTKFRMEKYGTVVEIVLPNNIIGTLKNPTIYDKNGRDLQLKSPAHISFRGEIPLWYIETSCYFITNIPDDYEVGEYVIIKV